MKNIKNIVIIYILSGLLFLQICVLIILKLPRESDIISPMPNSDSTTIAVANPNPITPENFAGFTEFTEIYTEILAENVDTADINNIDIIDSIIDNMTLNQKIGQLFFCAFRQDNLGNDIVGIDDNIKNIIKNYGIGGVVLFSENIVNSKQVTDYINDLQNESDIALFIGIDEEGGRVTRTNSLDVPEIPAALNIGKTGNPQNAYDYAKIIAGYLKPLGFNVDFAPVADVFTNPENTVIGDRAFSSDPYIAGEMVKYFTKGLLDNGILPSIKHFPGHGDTNEDSHFGIATTQKTLGELSELEFIPFKIGINANTPFVMVGHISTPNIDIDNTEDNNLPAIFSDFLLRDILRNSLGFNGIIITDSLDMGAITNYYTPAETAVKSILAGIDMLLIPSDFNNAYHGLLNAVNSGEISETRINESVKRILTVKYEFGLINLD